MSLSFCNQQLEAKLPIDKKQSAFALPTIAKLPVPSDNLILESPLNAIPETRRRQGMPCLYELAARFGQMMICSLQKTAVLRFLSTSKFLFVWDKTRGTCPSRTLPFAGYSGKATDIFD